MATVPPGRLWLVFTAMSFGAGGHPNWLYADGFQKLKKSERRNSHLFLLCSCVRSGSVLNGKGIESTMLLVLSHRAATVGRT